MKLKLRRSRLSLPPSASPPLVKVGRLGFSSDLRPAERIASNPANVGRGTDCWSKLKPWLCILGWHPHTVDHSWVTKRWLGWSWRLLCLSACSSLWLDIVFVSLHSPLNQPHDTFHIQPWPRDGWMQLQCDVGLNVYSACGFEFEHDINMLICTCAWLSCMSLHLPVEDHMCVATLFSITLIPLLKAKCNTVD